MRTFCTICKYTFATFVFASAFLHAGMDIIKIILPIAIITAGTLTLGFYVAKIPPVEPKVVHAVIGRPLTEETKCPSNYVIKTIAHRGAGLDAPENSLAAFDMCSEKGCHAVEFDVSLTADDVPVVFHDNDLNRMADLDYVVSDTNWDDLKNVDISVNHPFRERFVGTTIPTLNQTVEQLLKNGQRMFIDIKCGNTKMINVILDLYAQHPELHMKAVVSSFYPQIIYFIRRRNPRIVCSLAWRPTRFANHFSPTAVAGIGASRACSCNFMKHWLFCMFDILHEWLLPRVTYNLLGLSLILLHKDVISSKVVDDWRQKGVRVIAWTVNNPVEKLYFVSNLKVTSMTDTLSGDRLHFCTCPMGKVGNNC